MKENKSYKSKLITIGAEFELILDKFLILIKEDENMLDTIPENQRKKLEKRGFFSHAVKYLITQYVDSIWDEYYKQRKEK